MGSFPLRPRYSRERTCHPWKIITWWYKSPENGQRLHSSLGTAFPPFDFGPITASPHRGCRLHQNVGSKKLLRSLNSDDNVRNEGGQQTGFWLTIGHFLVYGTCCWKFWGPGSEGRPSSAAAQPLQIVFSFGPWSLADFWRYLDGNWVTQRYENEICVEQWSSTFETFFFHSSSTFETFFFILHFNIQEKLFNHDNVF